MIHFVCAFTTARAHALNSSAKEVCYLLCVFFFLIISVSLSVYSSFRHRFCAFLELSFCVHITMNVCVSVSVCLCVIYSRTSNYIVRQTSPICYSGNVCFSMRKRTIEKSLYICEFKGYRQEDRERGYMYQFTFCEIRWHRMHIE